MSIPAVLQTSGQCLDEVITGRRISADPEMGENQCI